MSQQKRILIIEDDREIAQTLISVLDAAGYTVVHAPNGVEGQRTVPQFRPHLVITDMMMPRMGGFPILEFLKTLDEPPRVIMITANEGSRHKAWAEMETDEKVAVDDYIRKPFAMDVLLDAVTRIIGEGDSDKPPSKPADTEARPRIMRRKKTD